MNTPKCTHQHALTIIELLVVIAILAILAALIFPALRGMNDRMNAANCMTNLRAFGAAVLTYRAEHDGYLPPGPPLLPPKSLSENNNPRAGADIKKDLIAGGYLKENDLPYCPAMRLSETGRKNLKPGQTPQSIFKRDGSYVLNNYLAQHKIEALPGLNAFGYPGDSRMLLAAESYFCGLSWAIDHLNITLKGMDYGTSYNHAPRSHGNNRLNFMFLDGHIASLAPKVMEDGTNVWVVRSNNKADLDDPEIPFDSSGRNGKYVQQQESYVP